MHGRVGRQTGELVEGQTYGQMDGWMDVWVDGLANGQMERWMDRWMYIHIHRGGRVLDVSIVLVSLTKYN